MTLDVLAARCWRALDVHPRVAMQILRHAQFAITMEIYTVISDGATREALKRLSEGLDG
jgi:integrase